MKINVNSSLTFKINQKHELKMQNNFPIPFQPIHLKLEGYLQLSDTSRAR